MTCDTSHSPIGPYVSKEQSPLGDNLRHASTAGLSSFLDCGENTVAEYWGWSVCGQKMQTGGNAAEVKREFGIICSLEWVNVFENESKAMNCKTPERNISSARLRQIPVPTAVTSRQHAGNERRQEYQNVSTMRREIELKMLICMRVSLRA